MANLLRSVRMFCLISSTTSTKPRPLTLHWITIRRRTFSRLTWLGPEPSRIVATFSSFVIPPLGKLIVSRPSVVMSSRYCSSSRTTRSNFRCPSSTSETTWPFIAVSTNSVTSERVKPYCSQSVAVDLNLHLRDFRLLFDLRVFDAIDVRSWRLRSIWHFVATSPDRRHKA